NTIWEGTSNMMCMDVVRVIGREPGALEAALDEIRQAASVDSRISAWANEIERLARDRDLAANQARRLTEMLALGVQASVLGRHSSSAVASAFVESRLDKRSGRTFGALENAQNLDAIVARASLSETPASKRLGERGQLARSVDEVNHRAVEATGLIQ